MPIVDTSSIITVDENAQIFFNDMIHFDANYRIIQCKSRAKPSVHAKTCSRREKRSVRCVCFTKHSTLRHIFVGLKSLDRWNSCVCIWCDFTSQKSSFNLASLFSSVNISWMSWKLHHNTKHFQRSHTVNQRQEIGTDTDGEVQRDTHTTQWIFLIHGSTNRSRIE